MKALPDLANLSESDKDELIRQLWLLVEGQRGMIEDLQSRLALNSRNSSKPPSSDGLSKPSPKSLRVKSGRSPGGQKGRRGVTLEQVQHPDEVVSHLPAARCDQCQGELNPDDARVVEVRQVFDLPPIKMQVTEHRSLQVRCGCGALHRGAFPAEVRGTVHYGPRARATMVYLHQQQMQPLARTAAMMRQLYGLPVSQAAVLKACEEAATRLAPVVETIAQQLQAAPVLHADETGLRVRKKLHWLHTAATTRLTWLGHHAKRGRIAFDELGILNRFKGVLIHDGWAPYKSLDCAHGLCNAHHLRELAWVTEELKQPWAEKLSALLTRGNRLKHQQHGAEMPTLLAPLLTEYASILDEGDALNPRVPACGKPGRARQSKAANLLRRLREHRDEVWRFMTDPNVPFTNNLAEQAVRMPKIKQKISGCFRTPRGADVFCIIRSYLASMHKQGADTFNALRETFNGNTPAPSFA